MGGCLPSQIQEEDEENGATPPSGPEDIPGPSALRFPSSVSIDVSTSASGSFGALTVDNKSFLGASGEFSDEIALGTDIFDFIADRFVSRIVSSEGILGDVVVDIDPDITRFKSTVSSSSEIFAGEELKIDFHRFLSGRSETTECSGTTYGLPVCFRVFVGGKGLLAGVLTSLVTETSDGAGFFWLKPSDELFGEGGPPSVGFTMGLQWDHTDPEAKTTEISFGGGLTSDTITQSGRALATQEGEDDEDPVKMVRMTSGFESFAGGEGGSTRYIGRWREGHDEWSGKVSSQFGSFSNENLDICARLSTGRALEEGRCEAAGIDTDAIDFLSLPDEEDWQLPSGFRSTPTF